MSRQSSNTQTGEVTIHPDAPIAVKSQAEVDAEAVAKEAQSLAQFDTPLMQTMIEVMADIVLNPPAGTAADLTTRIKDNHKAKGRTV